MGLLTKIEEVISLPLELFQTRKGFQPVDACRLVLRCMERGAKKGISKTYAPNRFNMYLSSADYREYKPFMSLIQSDIKGELRRVIEERSYLLAGELAIDILEDPEQEAGLPRIEGRMQGEKDPVSVILTRKNTDGDASAWRQIEARNAARNQTRNDAQTDEQDRDAPTVILLPEYPNPADSGVSIIQDVQARLETGIDGVCFHLGNGRLYLENRYGYSKATVNGRVQKETLISDADRIHIDRMTFVYKK